MEFELLRLLLKLKIYMHSSILKVFAFALAMVVTSGFAQVQYIKRKPENSLVIIFVHGVMGDSVATWTNSTTKAYFPALVASDSVFQRANVAVVDIPSPILGRAPSIDELAESMRLHLEAKEVLAHREIIFVTHSMGGLVTRSLLTKYREHAKKVKFIYFFATPTTGSSIASLARIISSNPQFEKMMPMTSDGYLADLQRTWLASPELAAIPSYCAYEQKSTMGVQIVDQQSATNLCNTRLDPINANHIDIVKPENQSAASYLAFLTVYRSRLSTGNTSLRVDVQNPRQIVALTGESPKFQGASVICDAGRLTLLIAHKRIDSTPIRIQSIAVKTKKLDLASGMMYGACTLDPLSSKPYGIVEVETAVITTTDAGVRARFLRNSNTAYPVVAQNLLEGPSGVRGITLKPDEEPFAFNVIVETKSVHPYHVWFDVLYDEDGFKKVSTAPITVWR
jgi:pimeloyl-ACP methyl ester carboxylesterase